MSPAVQRLGVGDLMTIWAQRPHAAMNIALAGQLTAEPLLDGAGRLRLGDLPAAIAARLDQAPVLRQRVRWTHFGQGQPALIDDTKFEIARHVDSIELPGGDDAVFANWAASWAARPLDLDRPLWRLRFVTGLSNATVGM